MQPTVLPESVKSMPLFAGLTEQEKETLLKEGRVRECGRGQALFHHGDSVTHFYLIISGSIQLFRENPDGKEKTIEVLIAGQTLGENEIMDSCRSHRMNATAISDSVLLEFSVSWLKTAAQKYSPLALNLLSTIAGQAYMASVEAEHQAYMSAAQLVACFLQRLCVLHEFNPQGFDLPYSKTLIASRLGMEIETLSRTLAKLKDQGIIVEGSRVSIYDAIRVAEYVCGFCSISGDCPAHTEMEKKSGFFLDTQAS